MQTKRKILVTGALPYANGPLHLGHLVGYIQADIWVRFQKMQGHDCVYVCGSDVHGTPIMIQADKLGITPLALVTDIQRSQEADFADFDIAFDHYDSTHSPTNKALVELIYERHLENKNIIKRTIKQLYDPLKNMFLPDRYVKGECPKCGAKDQYGDNCESCGATYAPTDIKNPVSALSGATPVEKESEHFFFKLQEFEAFLKAWTRQGHLQTEVANKLEEWFDAGLREWDISRDAPYFGFNIPDAPDKYFYVWLDAPIGYMASFKNFCEKNKKYSFDEYFNPATKTELYHFIGKDIVYFHALFWPSILKGADFRTPTAIFVNGYLTIDGQKMSKSRGTFIKARTYLDHFDAEYLRYYFAAKLSHRIEDLDISFDDFMYRINADLVGKYINIASRTASFLHKYFNNTLSDKIADQALLDEFINSNETIRISYESRDYSHAIRQIMSLADRANQYIDENKPWSAIKDEKNKSAVQDVCSMGIHLFRLLTLYLKPVLPKTASEVEAFLNIKPLQWEDVRTSLVKHTIHEFKPLITRIDPKQIEALKMSATEENTTKNSEPATTTPPEKTYISIDDFAKIDLRIATILEAEGVEGADKLLRLKVNIGTETRQIFAGIKAAFEPEKLIGRQVVIVANLAPRKMRFGMSEGMMIVAGDGEGSLFIVSPDVGAKPGMKVK